MESHQNRIGVLLLAMGGPDCPEAIRPYLYNIFSDRTLIRLPGGAMLQRPFAFLISRLRSKKVAAHYALIGGSSPLLQWTESQARHIEQFLNERGVSASCYVGMRYYHPTIAEAVSKMAEDGIERMAVLPMYPQYSTATTGSSVAELARCLRKFRRLKWSLIKDFHSCQAYIQLLREYIRSHTEDDDILLFSAHSLPQHFVEEGDPYVDQIYRTAELAANSREHYVSFQSRTGPVKWVGPDTIDETRRLLEETDRRICMVPVAFVCDHIETLYELDIELPQLAGGSGRLYRLPMFNADPRFGRVLANLVEERIGHDDEA